VAGYSGTPLPKKLGIKGNVALIGAPDGFARLIGVEPVPLRKGALDVVILFAPQQKALKAALKRAAAALKEDGNLWVAWPKKSSGVATDVTENLLRELILPTGLVDNKVCAVDDTWSGLRFCKRRENRK
jgi:Protein of unknown function (DUF3052)